MINNDGRTADKTLACRTNLHCRAGFLVFPEAWQCLWSSCLDFSTADCRVFPERADGTKFARGGFGLGEGAFLDVFVHAPIPR
ncbi:hypothetical protein G6321_00036765 [Bradyrhizobium barranii subsp. barranii]|uniref:Uncharacterized protein n=1 Tax=Bradyrhizobium barranii subsp. barranii TaxID=2823807 RepID=A0A7Z0QFX2_9BRAD|nr:hypothetical protein [Bradyrhizobium barranii]UGX91294.1 hypothetical protein G6321_00036765 [Bradyrhizobium barranii subsp. barranii]